MSMCVGEVALVNSEPQYAYGSIGRPPIVGPDMPVEFEIELISVRPRRQPELPLSDKAPSPLRSATQFPHHVGAAPVYTAREAPSVGTNPLLRKDASSYQRVLQFLEDSADPLDDGPCRSFLRRAPRAFD